jgi:acid phosphatase family membrane protein YuiD
MNGPVGGNGPDIWVVVILAVLAGQLLKFGLYSATQRRLQLAVLGQSAGLPSLHGVTGGALVATCWLHLGWQATETAVALVFAAIIVFDAMRVRAAAQQQRRLVHDLVLLAPRAGAWRRRVAGYLDIFAHTPIHVAVGVMWGFLFALAVTTV